VRAHLRGADNIRRTELHGRAPRDATLDEPAVVYDLRVYAEVVHIEFRDGRVAMQDFPAARPEVVLESDQQTLLARGTGRLSDRHALQTGLRIDGGGPSWHAFGGFFDPAQRERAV
jgi:hypothetical protein